MNSREAGSVQVGADRTGEIFLKGWDGASRMRTDNSFVSKLGHVRKLKFVSIRLWNTASLNISELARHWNCR